MRSLCRIATISILAGILVIPIRAVSDQDDPALDTLFERLSAAEDTAEANVIAAQIQNIWDNSGSERFDLLLEHGTYAMTNGNYVVAERAFSLIVEQHPTFAEGWNRRATLYFVMGRLDESISDVKRTLALAPRHYGALSGLGQIYVILGRFDDARNAFSRALAANPHLSGARQFLEALDLRLSEPI